MHFHDQAIGARGHRNARQCGDKIAVPSRVAGIGDHRKMRDLFEQGNRGYVEGVAHRCFKGADATLAKDHVVISLRKNIFGRQKKILDGTGHASLQKYRLLGLSHFL